MFQLLVVFMSTGRSPASHEQKSVEPPLDKNKKEEEGKIKREGG
jgi:hypothetical protein